MNKYFYAGAALLTLNLNCLVQAFLWAWDAESNSIAIAWLLIGVMMNTAVPALAWLYQLAKS